MEKFINNIKIDSPLVGKYFHANLIYSKWEKTWYSGLCYCTGVYNTNDNVFLTVQTQCGKEYDITQDRIVEEVIANPNPKYSVGQNVQATTDYIMNQPIDNYCTVQRVITFGNNVSYELTTIRENKKFIVQENSIKKIAVLKKPIFQLGIQVGVKIYPDTGYGYNEYTIKNGIITNIHQWFESVTYDVTFDDNTIQQKVYEGNIVEPYTPPPPVDMKKMWKKREQELLEELERVRSMIVDEYVK